MSFKKSNLLNLFEDDNTIIGEESTLNSSTVPTYEEFTKKTLSNQNIISGKNLNSTQAVNLVTDDESDEDSIQIKNLPIKNPILDKIKYTNSVDKTPKKTDDYSHLNVNSSSSKTLLKTVLTPQSSYNLPKTPKLIYSPVNNSPKSIKKKIHVQNDEPNDEYLIYSNKISQTSFNISINNEKSEEEEEKGDNKNNFIVNESVILIDSNPAKTNNYSYRDQSNTKDFNLHLSSSSPTNSDNDNDENNYKNTNLRTNLSPQFKSYTLNKKDNNVTRRKTNNQFGNNAPNKSKKRVSICGQALNDDVFNIDNTIIDQFDNELAQKNGLIFSIIESNENEDLADSHQAIFSSTKILFDKTNLDKQQNKASDGQIKRKNESSSDNDDAFEKFLNQYKPNTTQDKKVTTKKDLNDFLVEDSIEEESEDEEMEEKIKKKKVNRKLIDSKSKNKIKQNSSSSENIDKSESDDEYDEQYDKDLQLFYIKTTNKLINQESKNSDKNKKDDCTIITINDSSSSESSPSKLSDSSSLSSLSSPVNTRFKNDSSDSDNDDSFSKLFANKNIDLKKSRIFSEEKGFFKTPGKNLKKNDQDLRLVKTQYVQRKEEKIRKLSFIESLSSHLDNEQLRDPSVEYFIKKFHIKNVKYELFKECYRLFNKHSFDNQLPQDMKLVWSDKITSTAGYCKYLAKEHKCEIHLSNKVCTNPERLRDTLAHEMCHAAAFLINGCNDNHGPIWKSWTRKVNFAFKHIPKIKVTHSYSVEKKFIFKCQNCHLEIHRFSKSINIDKQVCGICHGRFEIIRNNKKNVQELEKINQARFNSQFDQIRDNEFGDAPKSVDNKLTTPRQPNKFALFVKDNYNSIKKEKNLNSHKDVMQELSKNFKLLSTK